MNALLNHWKLFAAFLFLGLFLAFGARAALTTEGAPPPSPQPAPPVHKHEPAPVESKGLLIDLGNKMCPVMGGAVDGQTFLEWNHLRIGNCCAGCDRKFLKNPAGVLDGAGIEWREAEKAVQEYLDAGSKHKDHMLASIRKRWTVVREPSGG